MHNFRVCIALFLFFIIATIQQSNDKWAPVDKILKDAIADEAFPGAVALVADERGPIYMRAFGRHTYDNNSPPMNFDTSFDMASVTKVFATTSAIAEFYQRGEISLDLKIASIWPEFAQEGKQDITIKHLLLHNSGFPAGPTPVYFSKAFGCPEAQKPKPKLAFTCQRQIFEALMKQKLQYKTGKEYIYSDLSMIALMYVVGHYAKILNKVSPKDLRSDCPIGQRGDEQCYYEAYVRKMFENIGMTNSQFKCLDKNNCPPAWNETTSFRHEIVHGYVSDENAYMLGGIAGHAGLFSTIKDSYIILHHYLFPKAGKFLNATTIKRFTTVENATFSWRALGWGVNVVTDGSCATLSKTTFFHTGYTGTGVCADPERKLLTVLLTNRCYPWKTNPKIGDVRSKFNTAVQKIYDEFYKK